MIIPVMCKYIEAHTSEHLFNLSIILCKLKSKSHKQLIIKVRKSMGRLQQATDRNCMDPLPLLPVKSPRGKKAITQPAFQQSCFRHLYPAFPGTKRVFILLNPYILWVEGGWSLNPPLYLSQAGKTKLHYHHLQPGPAFEGHLRHMDLYLFSSASYQLSVSPIHQEGCLQTLQRSPQTGHSPLGGRPVHTAEVKRD